MGSCPDGGRVVDGGAQHVGRVAVFAGAGGYPFARAPPDRFISAMGVSAALALVGAVAEMGLLPGRREMALYVRIVAILRFHHGECWRAIF
jgi:hypothetical protein